MKMFTRVAIGVLVTLPVWATLWAQEKSAPAPPKPTPASTPSTPETKPATPAGKQPEEPIDKRRDRMKQRDGEIDKIMKQKGK